MKKLIITTIATLLLSGCTAWKYQTTDRGPELSATGKMSKIRWKIDAQDVAAIIKAVNGYKQNRKAKCEKAPKCDIEKPKEIRSKSGKIFTVEW